jgi:SAM-dependent methyltransferase
MAKPSFPDYGPEFWNRLGLVYPRSFFGSPTTRLYLENEQRLMARHFGDLRGKTLLKLDLWNEAQNTEILFWTKQQGAACFGIDIARTTAAKAMSRSRALQIPIEIAIADAARIPFVSDSFDFAYTMGTIEHLARPPAALAEIARVLRPGGLAIIGVPSTEDPFLFAKASLLMQRLGVYPYGLERWYSIETLCRQVEESGLKVVGRDGILFLPWILRWLDLYLWLHCREACAVTSLLTRPFRWLARRPGLAEKYGYLTVAVAAKPSQ